ncbi:MAG: NAD-dependent epimerase/dehydratase family protein [Myxococcales bacterium]|nr:NAD-dependent epimerase/dehydratase family protein [Myxococcales bacterium]MCB9712626.1 NAD-dependent epimerase/dehydratase family protein [Myxococcales bacterium]
MATTLITGSSGFVGRHLVDAFAGRGDTVIALDVAGEPWRDDVRWETADIRDAERLAALCEGVDTVVHNASVVHTRRNKESFVWEVNHGGTRNVLAACRAQGVPKLVYMSSASAVYEGRDIENGDESLPYSSISQAPYADSKIAAEKDVLAANGEGGVATCALRPHVVFGPYDQRLLPALLQRARAGKLKLGVGRGDKLSDFTYVDNLIDATVAAQERLAPGSPVAGQAYFITNAEPMDFFAFVDAVLDRIGLPRIRGRIPFGVAYPVAAIKEAWDTLKGGTLGNEGSFSRFTVRYMCTHHYFSIDKARRDLGYEPRVSIAEGLDRTVAHLRELGQV